MNRYRLYARLFKKVSHSSAIVRTDSVSQKTPRFFRFSMQEKILFAKRLGMILRSGMPIMNGLSILYDESQSRSARFLYQSLMHDVESGKSLAQALERFPGVFDTFFSHIVRSAERSGTLSQNLEYLAEEIRRSQQLKSKVVGALIYPVLIMSVTILITAMLTIYIFPKIVPIFQSVHTELPLSTRAVMWVSDVLSDYGVLILIASCVCVVSFFFARRTSTRFHEYTDAFIVRVPLIGTLIRLYNLSTISRTMALLLKSGVSIVESLELVTHTTSNTIYSVELLRAKENILRGHTMSQRLKLRRDIFPSLFTHMLSTAESTGNMQDTFVFLASHFDEELDELTRRITTLIEPLLMICMGIVVGFIAVSIITPIYSITQMLTPR
jgi:type II secretory pathway component PulF